MSSSGNQYGKPRREFLQGAGAALLAATAPGWAEAAGDYVSLRPGDSGLGADDISAIRAEIAKRHEEAL